MRPMQTALREQKEGPNGYKTVERDLFGRQGCEVFVQERLWVAEDENLM